MSSKKNMVIFGLITAMILLLLIVYFLIPKIDIRINGNEKEIVNYNEEYIELGAKAFYKNIFSSKELEVETIGTVNTKKVGKYKITYKASYNNLASERIRLVEVVDKEKPKLTLNSEARICKANETINIDATAKDNYDGDITDKITYRTDESNIYISVTDSSNNRTEIVQKILYMNDDKPIITLNGSEKINLIIGENYTELGASASDSCDGNISNNIEVIGNVDINKIGTYEIQYKVKDSDNNETIAKRIVNVVSKENNINIVTDKATIYLTFDDGPGPYTEEILNILEEYGIKATFFVTNQFGNQNYLKLIKLEYDKGHTVGIHTYTHKWTIYSSVETYLDDFEKIQNVIVAQTGEPAKIFRFPGGSSNTVSCKYSKGIMTKLAKIMTDKGYTYFDWTFDSGDTNKTDNSKEAIMNNFKKYLKGNGEYIVLMHDIKKNTLAVLPEVINYAQGLGYSFAAIDETTTPYHFKIAN